MLIISDPSQKLQKKRFDKRIAWAKALFTSGVLFFLGDVCIPVPPREEAQCTQYAQCDNAASAFQFLSQLSLLCIIFSIIVFAVALYYRKR
jgi:hypothetical protein